MRGDEGEVIFLKEPLWYRLSVPLLKRTDISPVEKLILTVMLDQCENEPTALSTPEIAEACGISTRTAQRAIDHLAETAAIAVQHRTGACSVYQVVVSQWLPPKQRVEKNQKPQQRYQRRGRGGDAGTSTADGTASFDISDFEKLTNCF